MIEKQFNYNLLVVTSQPNSFNHPNQRKVIPRIKKNEYQQ